MLSASVLRAKRCGFAALLVAFHAREPMAIAAGCQPAKGLSPCIDADNLWPHAGGGAYFAIGSTATTPRGAVAVGLVGSFLSQPIGVHIASADPNGSNVFLVDKAFDATLLFAFGITDRFELTLATPGTVYQTGAGISAVAGAAETQPHTPFRDLRFGFSVGILQREPEATRGPALVARLEFSVPTASSDAFAGGRTAVLVPSAVFSYRIRRVDISAEAVARVRGEATLANAVVGTQVGGALGASVDVIKERWLGLGAEAFVLCTTSAQRVDSQNPTQSVSPLIPAEWIAHASTAHFLGGDLTLGLGGGSTIPFTPHGALTSPQYRLDLAVRYAPVR